MQIHDRNRLNELRALPLDRKIGFTSARIAEWYNHFGGKVHVSFSGGKDSTVLLYLVRKLFPDVRAMFVDTGLEYPEIKDFVKTFENVDIVRPKKTFLQVIREYGFPVIGKEVAHYVYYARKGQGWASCALGVLESYITKNGKELAFRRGTRYDFTKYGFLVNAPFKIGDQCCAIMKKTPACKYAAEHGTFPMLATMTDESRMREKAWLQHGCNAFEAKYPISTPMAFWTEQDVLQYIKAMNIPICSCYGQIVGGGGNLHTTGCERTGCMFCMFGITHDKTPNRFQRMAYTHPKQYEYCIKKLGIGEVLDFLKVPYEPEPDLFPESFKTTTNKEPKQ